MARASFPAVIVKEDSTIRLSRTRLSSAQQSGPECRLHRGRESTCHLQLGHRKALGCGDGQAPRWLERHHRELREDWTLGVRPAGGLVWWTTLSLPPCCLQNARSINGGRC